MGEVEGAGRELGGLALNIGARVAAEAGPGEILVSRPVHDVLAGSAFDFEDRGVRALKGVPGEWRLFAVTGVPEDTGQAISRRWTDTFPRHRALVGGAVVSALLLSAAALYVIRRDAGIVLIPEEVLAADAAPGIAVLPFTVNDPALDTWREGMVDLLSINLDGVPGLRPIASRTVMARWREEVEGIPDLAATLQVARRTGARYALVGNAVSIGSEVRFAAEIYDARTGKHLGSAGAQGSPDSVFALVDLLSVEVVRALPQGEGGFSQSSIWQASRRPRCRPSRRFWKARVLTGGRTTSGRSPPFTVRSRRILSSRWRSCGWERRTPSGAISSSPRPVSQRSWTGFPNARR
jgi:TolB-like protein